MSLSGNTAKINELLSKINALPEAGSGGGSGGASVETCTVTMSGADSYGRPNNFTYTALDDNGEIAGNLVSRNTSTSVTINNVVCNTIIAVSPASSNYSRVTATNATQIYVASTFFFIRITASAGETATIRFDMGGGGSN